MRRWGFVASCLLLAALFAGLGIWQVERRAWKLDLIARVDARVGAAPQALPTDWSGDLAYTRVRTSGVFDHRAETRVQALTARGAGWWVLTPLRTERGTVIVNRGFVPAERRDWSRPSGPVTITGLLRASEPGGGFLRRNDAATGRWYSRDVAAIARAHGVRTVAAYFIDADATADPGGFPVGGLTVIRFRNTHLLYALTWFGLAALSLAGAWLAWRRR